MGNGIGSCRRRVRRAGGLAAVVLVVSPLFAACSTNRGDEMVLNFYGPSDGAEQYGQAAADCTAQAGGAYRISYQVLAKQADDQRLQLARRIVGGDATVDVVGLDVTWTAEFAEAGWVVAFPAGDAQRATKGTLAGPLATATWKDQLFAAPLNTNTQLLWYRKDLMPGGRPPNTWEQLVGISEGLADRGKPSWIEVQAAQYEGLTVWFNTLLASAGGAILGQAGRAVTVAEGSAAQQALMIMRRVATAKGADPSLSQRDEGTGRLAMESGNAAFEVNYPFVLPGIATNGGGSFLDAEGKPTTTNTGRKVQDEFAWAPYPSVTAGQPAKVTIGGLNLAVSSTSQHPTEAFRAIGCLRDEANQLRNAVKGGVPPTLESLYANPDFQAAYPAWKDIKLALDNASVRPATPAYQSISILLSATLNPPAEIDPQTTVGVLAGQVQRAVNSEGLVP